MESHPLNLAHQQHRRAEAHLINNRYDEAMQCHHNAAELLLDAMKSTTSSVALESITLQHSYHLKQKALIKCKKEQYARIKKAMENLKILGKDPLNQTNDHAKVQVAIYRVINETDNLLGVLCNKKDDDDPSLLKDVTVKDVIDGKKIEKSQETVIEEMQILNQNLHSLVEQLVFQVEVLKDENSTLKERVSYLEKERVKYLNLPSSTNDLLQKNFSMVGTVTDGYSKDFTPVPITNPASKAVTYNAIERLNQQPHFDLSALKDD
ncbi:nuclear receptor-binding factor 2-like [Pectinophora gossypiella]|uniref:Nuclear receptor-binding factor 2 MIT domain-containing protein n=1 Tax=Pectinophora gossypiella TaxID=13191 RepID=A0A1E1WVD5_PECGO|nr:nuclear receptor-binding factor 2-like [Pectinophora gossypiella]